MKIKIIDLLNKIANGEKVPKKIKYNNNIYEYCQNDNRYHQITKNYPNRDMDDLSKVIGLMNFNYLNDEVEIIEDKKIEKIGEKPDTILYEFNDYDGMLEDALDWNFKVIEDKINVLSDALINIINKLKEGK